MNVDVELEKWQALWQADVEVPADLREKANKQLRRMRIMLIADIVVTVVMGGAALVWGLMSKEPSVRLLAAWVWMSLLAAWFFRWFNGGGNFTGAAPNTEVLLELLERRYRSSLRSVKFGYFLGVVQLLFSSWWVYVELNRHSPITVWQFVTLKASLAAWLCVACLLGAAMWLSRKLTRELAHVEQLRSDWAGCENGPVIPERTLRVGSSDPISVLNACLTMFTERLWGLGLRRKKKIGKA